MGRTGYDELLDREKDRHAAWCRSLREENGGLPAAFANRRLRGLAVIPTSIGVQLIEAALAAGTPVRLPNYEVVKVFYMRDGMSKVKGSAPATVVRIGSVEPMYGSHRMTYPMDLDFRRANLPEFAQMLPRELSLAAGSDEKEWRECKERFGSETCGISFGAALPSSYLLTLNELNELIDEFAANGFVGGKPLCPQYNEKFGTKRLALPDQPSFTLWSGFDLLGDEDEEPESLFSSATTDGEERFSVQCPHCRRKYMLDSLDKLDGFEVFEDGDFLYTCKCGEFNRCLLDSDVTATEPEVKVPEWLQRNMTREALDGLPLKAPADLTVTSVMEDAEFGCTLYRLQLTGGRWFMVALPSFVKIEQKSFVRGEVVCRVFHDSPVRIRDGVFGCDPELLGTSAGIRESLLSGNLDQRFDGLRQLCDPIPDATRKMRSSVWGKFRETERRLIALMKDKTTPELTRERVVRLFNMYKTRLDDTAPPSAFFTMVQKAWFDFQGQIIEYGGKLLTFYTEKQVVQSERQAAGLVWQFEPGDWNKQAKAMVCRPVPTTPEDAGNEAIGFLTADSLPSNRFYMPRLKKRVPEVQKGQQAPKKKGKKRRRRRRKATAK
jgi:hypothetical protein